VTWRQDDSSEEYHRYLRRPCWEVVVPELVFSAPERAHGPRCNGAPAEER
jgi:hypothetical protein